MRIIGGSLRGRRLVGSVGCSTRPTSDRVREAIASALQSRDAFSRAHVLDLFAGTGALSFEALSRGAESAVLIDCDRRAIKTITDNARTFGLQNRIRVLCLDLLKAPASVMARIPFKQSRQFDLIFADPPYQAIDSLIPLLSEITSRKWLGSNGLMIVEHATKHPPKEINQLGPVDNYRYGDTTMTIVHHPVQGEQ